jgi:aspartokinase
LGWAMNDTILMEGIKLSSDWIQVNVASPSLTEEIVARFLRGLADNRINMSLFIGGKGSGGIQFTCCVAVPDEERVKTLTAPIPDLKGGVEFSGPVDLMSVFPHQFNLKALGLSLVALGKAKIPMHGFSSSLSALTFIVDHTDLDQASSVLQGSFSFHADPPRTLC